jgi:hypothetical protein
MNSYVTPDQPNQIARITGKRTRKRHPLPQLETRDWMTPNETALALGCSVAMVHRLRRGVIPGVEPLPSDLLISPRDFCRAVKAE